MKKAILALALILVVGIVIGMTPVAGGCGLFDKVGRSFVFQPVANYKPHLVDELPHADNHTHYHFDNVTGKDQKFTGVCYYLGPDKTWDEYWDIVQFCFSDACYFPGVPGQTGSEIKNNVAEVMTAQFAPPGKPEDAKFGKFGTGKVEVYPTADKNCKDVMYIAGVHIPYTVVTLMIDNTDMKVEKCTEWRKTGKPYNGRYPLVPETKKLDQAATIVGGRTYIPLRALADELYSEVGWDGATRTASFTISEGSCYYKMALQIDNDTATCTLKAGDGKILTDKVKMSAPAIIKNGRTLVPVRSLGEDLMGGKILWDGDTRTVTLHLPPYVEEH